MAAATVVYDCSCCLLRTIINCQLSLVVLPFVVPKVGRSYDFDVRSTTGKVTIALAYAIKSSYVVK